MPKEMKYNSVAERDLAERDPREMLARLIAILEDQHPGFYEEGLNKLYPRKDNEPHEASYTKPQ